MILGNGGFTSGNGVTAGSGVSNDPYVIQGWDINASSVNGITIANTTAYFVIDSVSIHDGIRGIFILNATHGLIRNSEITKNQIGVLLETSPNNTLSDNHLSYNVQATVANYSGELTISGNIVSLQTGSDKAVLLNSSPNSVLTNNNVSMNGGWGIFFERSPNAQVSGNIISSNAVSGIHMEQSPGATIYSNNITRNGSGITMTDSPKATISYNQFSWNNVGLSVNLGPEGDDIISNNNFALDTIGIMCCVSGRNETIQDNKFVYDGLFFSQVSTNVSSFKIIGNTVNDRPLLFFKDCSNVVVSNVPVGQLIAVNCKNMQISDLRIANTVVGIKLLNVSDTVISRNSVNSNSRAGLILWGRNISVTFNNISNNPYSSAIEPPFDPTQPLLAHHNNFIHDAVQGDRDGVWDDGYPSGGNFWSDYVGVDNCSGPSQNICPSPDEIGDAPFHLIGQGAMDRYPLIKLYLSSSDALPPAWLPQSVLTASTLSPTSVTLSWTMAADDVGIDYYRLYQGSTTISTVLADTRTDVLRRDVTGLEPGTTYTFRVEAVDWVGNPSTSGPSITITTPSTGPAEMPATPWWVQYWYVVASAASALGIAAAILFRLRRRRTPVQARNLST